MEHVIPAGNWTTALADTIEQSSNGDIIIVSDEAEKEMGESAKARMCPDKQITFEVRITDVF